MHGHGAGGAWGSLHAEWNQWGQPPFPLCCCQSRWPSSPLQPPSLRRFVSDYAFNGYKYVCQHKILQAMLKSQFGPEVARAYPPSLLEWTTNRQRANMALDIYCFNGEGGADLGLTAALLGAMGQKRGQNWALIFWGEVLGGQEGTGRLWGARLLGSGGRERSGDEWREGRMKGCGTEGQRGHSTWGSCLLDLGVQPPFSPTRSQVGAGSMWTGNGAREVTGCRDLPR